MPRYRDRLPQLGGAFFLTDGGIETTLVFHRGIELPDFAAFDLLRRPGGEETLREYFRPYAELARRYRTGLVLESATWRANPDWGTRLGYSAEELVEANRRAVRMLEPFRAQLETAATPVVLSGCVGPRGDGYVPGQTMSPAEAEDYHAAAIRVLAGTAADLVTAITMNYTEEAIGIARAARRAGMPVVLSFTVETDGRLPTGQRLGDAIAQVDDATGRAPAYYMINCAHPTHFEGELRAGGPWLERLRGVRANASTKSHAELNEATELDCGDPTRFGEEHAALKRRLPALTVMGGCCGTDDRHVEAVARACAPLFRAG